MKILLTGATGYIGSSVLGALLTRGHDVIAPVRSDSAARTATRAGATAVVGDLTETSWFVPLLRRVDATIHTAAPGDHTAPRFENAVVDAVIAAYGGSTKPYVHTGGVWVHGSSDDVTEDTPFAPPALVAWREQIDARLVAADLALSIVAPGVVYGYGAGLPASLARAPRNGNGRLTVVGDGSQHWTTVHVDDVADLYARVVEHPAPVGRVLGISGHNPTVAELGEAFSDGPVDPEGPDATRARLGTAYADALMLDQQGRGAKARSLGWRPVRPSLVDEIRAGGYAVASEG